MRRLFLPAWPIFLIANLAAQQITSLAVMDFEARGIANHEAASLTDWLRSELVRDEGITLVERGQMQAILAEQDFQLTGCTSDDCAVQVGQLLGVSHIVAGSIGHVGSTFSVVARIIDVETGRIVKTVKRRYRGTIDNLYDEMTPIATEILGGQAESEGEQRQSDATVMSGEADEKSVRDYAPKRSDIIVVGGQGRTSFGVKVGLNLANIGGSDVKKIDPAPSMKLGAIVGGYATLDFNLPVTIQLEGLYSMKGYVLEESGFKSTVAINYIDINILAKYEAAANINVLAGPSLGLSLGGRWEWEEGGESETEDIKSDDLNGMDFGFIVGAGYHLGTISVEARYSLGLKKAYNKDLDAKNNVIQIMVGYGL